MEQRKDGGVGFEVERGERGAAAVDGEAGASRVVLRAVGARNESIGGLGGAAREGRRPISVARGRLVSRRCRRHVRTSDARRSSSFPTCSVPSGGPSATGSATKSRRRHRDRLARTLAILESSDVDPPQRADVVLDALFVFEPLEGGDPCPCSCHPRLPGSDFHDYGLGCSCRLTAGEREQRFAAWLAEMDAYRDSPEGRAEGTTHRREEDALLAWLEQEPDVIVAEHGGMAPEQWHGTVDGHSFYFRERHDHWRIELDLRPSGHFYRTWVDGLLDDDTSYELRETQEGDRIAEGVVTVAGYGGTPTERARFIVDTIRTHLAREACTVHRFELEDLEDRLGRPLRWCPACGRRLSPPTSV